MPQPSSIQCQDDYIAAAPAQVQPVLRQIQATVSALVPDATPCISYRMPAFRLQRTFFYFAAFKHHIGIYPPVRGDAALLAELAPYRGDKGNLTFPLKHPVPVELIGRVALALAREVGTR